MRAARLPSVLDTERLILRAWCTADAPRLLPLLEANVEHLSAWIPAHVANPAPLHELALRLAGFAESFAAGTSWRWSIRPRESGALAGEVSLFPRSYSGRVPFAVADRVEIGYWLDRAATGRGYATEAARALLELSLGLPGIEQVEIRCDPRNVASAAVPRRLGFRVVDDGSADGSDPPVMTWSYAP
ncbi:MAG TPA: GNAT family N-acetyltransferase [Woeseiaceae bacterium]|nr:GNAT family N-acetyltransferase [Woeseiaceae bacterium]